MTTKKAVAKPAAKKVIAKIAKKAVAKPSVPAFIAKTAKELVKSQAVAKKKNVEKAVRKQTVTKPTKENPTGGDPVVATPSPADAKALKVIAAAEKKLKPIAHEINVRFEKAAKLEHDADDHRLAAALRLAEAEKVCDEAKLKFREWAAKNVIQGFETVRKLAAVGNAPEPAKALEDMRNRNKEANKELRERQKQERLAARAAKNNPAGNGNGAFAEQHERNKAGAQTGTPMLQSVKEAFDALDASDQLDMAKYAAEQIGGELTTL